MCKVSVLDPLSMHKIKQVKQKNNNSKFKLKLYTQNNGNKKKSKLFCFVVTYKMAYTPIISVCHFTKVAIIWRGYFRCGYSARSWH